MGEFDLSRVSDPTEVLLGRAEVRLDSTSAWWIEVPNGSMSLEEYRIRKDLDEEYEAYFKSKNNQTILLSAFFWSSIFVPLITAHEMSVDKLTATETALLFPFLLIGLLAAGALTSIPVDHLRMKSWEKKELEKFGLEPKKAMLEEDNHDVRQAYRLLDLSLKRLIELDLSVNLRFSLEDVEREFHLLLGRWQKTDDRNVREATLKRLRQLAIQTSALCEAEEFKARAQEDAMNHALEDEGVDLKNAIRSAAEDAALVTPVDTLDPLELDTKL